MNRQQRREAERQTEKREKVIAKLSEAEQQTLVDYINSTVNKTWDNVEDTLCETMRKYHISIDRMKAIFQEFRIDTNRKFAEEGKKIKLKEIPQQVILVKSDFEDFCEEIMCSRCNNCKANWKGCKLYKLMDNNGVEKSGYELKNCKYAYGKEVV